MRDRTDELARVETEDNGSLLLGNSKNVINRGAHNLEFFADFALARWHTRSSRVRSVTTTSATTPRAWLRW